MSEDNKQKRLMILPRKDRFWDLLLVGCFGLVSLILLIFVGIHWILCLIIFVIGAFVPRILIFFFWTRKRGTLEYDARDLDDVKKFVEIYVSKKTDDNKMKPNKDYNDNDCYDYVIHSHQLALSKYKIPFLLSVLIKEDKSVKTLTETDDEFLIVLTDMRHNRKPNILGTLKQLQFESIKDLLDYFIKEQGFSLMQLTEEQHKIEQDLKIQEFNIIDKVKGMFEKFSGDGQ